MINPSFPVPDYSVHIMYMFVLSEIISITNIATANPRYWIIIIPLVIVYPGLALLGMAA